MKKNDNSFDNKTDFFELETFCNSTLRFKDG